MGRYHCLPGYALHTLLAPQRQLRAALKPPPPADDDWFEQRTIPIDGMRAAASDDAAGCLTTPA